MKKSKRPVKKSAKKTSKKVQPTKWMREVKKKVGTEVEVEAPKIEKKVLPLDQRVRRKYARLKELVEGVGKKFINGVAVSGERGLGKSWTIRTVLDAFVNERQIKKITGHISPLMVYNTLAENRDEDSIIWFDDCDNAFTDATAMNILKAAMDTSEPRIVSWATTSKLAETPDFRFRGRVIISTNVKLARSPHLAAFLDRIHWCNMFLNLDEKVFKISELAKESTVDPAIVEPVLEWIVDNKDRIGNLLSLRTFVKVVDLAKFSTNWRDLALAMVEETEEVLGAPETMGEEQMGERRKKGKGKGKEKKVGTAAAGPDTSKAAYRGEYKAGSLSQIVFDLMRDGKQRTIEEIEVVFKKTSDKAQVPAVLNRIQRHGATSGAWAIESPDGNSFVMVK